MGAIFALITGIALLLTLILWLKLNAFLSLSIAALATGLVAGMSPAAVINAFQSGVGSTLGGLAPVLALGVLLGGILAESGAVNVIAANLIRLFGANRARWALACTGFVVGIAMFYNAGFVVLAPLVFSIAAATGQSLVPLAIAMATPLSVTHGFLPPHPSATAVAILFKADMGKTLILGLIVAIPAILLGGIVFPRLLSKIPANPPHGLFVEKTFQQETLPSFGKSIFIATLPVILMGVSTWAELTLPEGHTWRIWAKFFGEPVISLLLSVLLGLLLFSNNVLSRRLHSLFQNGQQLAKVSPYERLEQASTAIGAAAMLLLVIGAGGAFKQVLVETGIGKSLAGEMANWSVSPLLLGWGVATIIRIAVGSATVAGMTAAGIISPLLIDPNISPELMTIAVGAGSLMCSHVNDTGFWMFKEWFGLSVRDTFKTWTVMETIVGSCGLIGVLLLDQFI